jgi:hypothetical protein
MSVAALHTVSAKQLADEAMARGSLDWLQHARHTGARPVDRSPG